MPEQFNLQLRERRTVPSIPIDATQARKHNSIVKAQKRSKAMLLCLPAEIRNIIYDLVFREIVWKWKARWDSVCVRRATAYEEAPEGWPTALRRRRYPFALLRVCRQLYNDTRRLPFDMATFKFQCLSHLEDWLATTAPPYIATLRVEVLYHCGQFISLGLKPPAGTWIGYDFPYCTDSTTRKFELPSLAELHIKARCSVWGYRNSRWSGHGYTLETKRALEKKGINITVTFEKNRVREGCAFGQHTIKEKRQIVLD